jgi:hypothetical protein
MGFAKKISPANRIREQIDLAEMVLRLGMTVPLEFKNQANEELAIHASVHIFSPDRLDSLVREVVQFAYDETFNMLKRQLTSAQAMESPPYD